MSHTKSQHVFRGALILSAAALFTKILSAAYRIPFQNIAGDLGFYVYQQVYPFYAVAFTFSIYCFPVLLSNELADSKNKGKESKITSSFLFIVTVMTLFIGVALLLFSSSIANFMGDPKLSFPLQITAFIYFIVPLYH